MELTGKILDIHISATFVVVRFAYGLLHLRRAVFVAYGDTATTLIDLDRWTYNGDIGIRVSDNEIIGAWRIQ